MLLTTAHVVPEALEPEKVWLSFQGLDYATDRVRIGRVIWTSPTQELDATIVEPERLPDGVTLCPIASAMPLRSAYLRERVCRHRPSPGTGRAEAVDSR